MKKAELIDHLRHKYPSYTRDQILDEVENIAHGATKECPSMKHYDWTKPPKVASIRPDMRPAARRPEP